MNTIQQTTGQQSRTTQSSASENTNTVLGRDDFLKLLITQLQHQDPTSPVDNTQMIAQLAQFSALEQEQRTGDLIEELVTLTQRNEQLAATSYIGKMVRSKGYQIVKENNTTSPLYYSSNQDIYEGKVYIQNSDGEIVYTEDIGNKQAGTYTFEWNGLTTDGKSLPDGTYSVAIQAKTADGDSILVYTEVLGEVTSAVTENGTTYLRLKDGRIVELNNVYEVSSLSSSTTDNTNQENSTNTGVNTSNTEEQIATTKLQSIYGDTFTPHLKNTAWGGNKS